MEPLWKLPPYELTPAPGGGWAVQSEDGFGAALAVFAPLRKDGDWALAIPDTKVLELTEVFDDSWTTVALPEAPDATHFLCVLRYDHPAEHPGSSYFRMELAPASGPQPFAAPGVAGSELRKGLEAIRAQLRDRARSQDPLELFVVPAPAARPPATTIQARSRSAPTETPELPDTLCFAFASCQYPAGMLDRPVAYASYERLADFIEQERKEPERLLLLGDQVYTDASYGLVDPARLDDRYRIPYEDFSDREMGPFACLPQTLLARRRMTPDDHEFRDDWAPGAGDPVAAKLGLEAYWKYQRRAMPQAGLQIIEAGPGWRLFMADSRTQREVRNERNVEQARILGPLQEPQLHEWLRAAQPGELSIVTTAAMLLPRTRQYLDEPLYLDAWTGFPASLKGLLALLCEERIHNVVFLSGDAHLACDARVQVTRPGSDRHASFASLHAPALYAPYPFANEEPANLLLQDAFGFDFEGRHYECTVSAQVLGDGASGCGLLRASRRDQRWCVGYELL